MLKDGLRKEHINMVDLMSNHGGKSGESIMMEDLLSNGCLQLSTLQSIQFNWHCPNLYITLGIVI